MLHALAAQRSQREVWWVHGARNGSEHPFREEVRELVGRLPNGRLHVRYSRPEPRDALGHDFHAEGRIDAAALRAPRRRRATPSTTSAGRPRSSTS